MVKKILYKRGNNVYNIFLSVVLMISKLGNLAADHARHVAARAAARRVCLVRLSFRLNPRRKEARSVGLVSSATGAVRNKVELFPDAFAWNASHVSCYEGLDPVSSFSEDLFFADSVEVELLALCIERAHLCFGGCWLQGEWVKTNHFNFFFTIQKWFNMVQVSSMASNTLDI